ncbi:MAG: alpha/beta fold hydrolase [Cyanobacteria bacterium J06598_3]
MLLAVIAYSLSLGLIWANQPKLLYKPTHVLQNTPADHNLDFQEHWIPVQRCVKHPDVLHSWWLRQPKNIEPQNHLGTLLYFHGAGLNIGYNVAQAHWMQKLGFNVLVVEYRGYGLSDQVNSHPGEDGDFPTERTFYEDAEAALRYLKTTWDIPDKEIFVYGHSLGGAIGINLAVHHPDLAGLIVQNTFTTMADVVARSAYAGWFPVSAILNQHFPSLQRVRDLKMPLLFIHATGDRKIPVEMGEQLYAAAPEPKTLLLVNSDVHHNAAAVYKSAAHLSQIRQFAEASLRVLD